MAKELSLGEKAAATDMFDGDPPSDSSLVTSRLPDPPPSARPTQEAIRISSDRELEEPKISGFKGPSDKVNSIQASRSRRRSAPLGSTSMQRSVRSGAQASAPEAEAPPVNSSTDLKTEHSATRWAVPAEVARRFVTVGRSYYFQDGTRAFHDRRKTLVSDSENTEVIRGLIAIAKTRGWSDVTVGGSERFRSEVWQQGKADGLEVRGHRPTEVEKAKLVRKLVSEALRNGPSTLVSATRDVPQSQVPSNLKMGPRDEGPVMGQLVEHGPAPYRFDQTEPSSYFVRLKTAKGEQVLWGKDLQRAIAESITRVSVGDEIGARRVRRDPVQVRAPERDASGEVTGERQFEAHRTRWSVETRGFFAARSVVASAFRDSRVDPTDVARKNPELAGEYLTVRAAQLIAENRIIDTADRDRFTSAVRERVASAYERGESRTVRMTTRNRAGAARAALNQDLSRT